MVDTVLGSLSGDQMHYTESTPPIRGVGVYAMCALVAGVLLCAIRASTAHGYVEREAAVCGCCTRSRMIIHSVSL